ncbi:hypothetical protein SISNIDRAFT_418906 [Sistotremastrum niveocremeum HHB9708]|uniref:Ferritin-like domain-containing protein n=2 Tax=Sistotremastraceae TaxID=3402574 RepID=A0A164NPH7_9AGAM|nr:hypothetical protein SISNIDRAFT_418906 [Sistotremastrum niveocremeum HHB9708]KZT31828.1 hypothetical protein SISSUDRAFT_1067427 [Sistotremastrum suecicum HHB10207 ss-3]
MLFATFVASSLAVAAVALPTQKRADVPTATDILQYALTLEHLEAAFYSQYLDQFDAAAFEKDGYAPWVRGRFEQIAQHEATHVSFLSSALGDAATKACTYKFPVTDPKSFVALSQILEGVGVTAYLGAAQFLTADLVPVAGSILTTEARHAAWVGSAVSQGTPWSGAFDTPQTLDEVYSLASSFITGCPSSNPALPVKAFPALTVGPAAPAAGSSVTLTFDGAADGQFLALMTGLTPKFVPISSGKATLPAGLQGTVYAVVSKNGTAVSDEDTVAGPAILSFPFDSYASNPQ